MSINQRFLRQIVLHISKPNTALLASPTPGENADAPPHSALEKPML